MRQRFTNLCRRLHLNHEKPSLTVERFQKPVLEGGQYDLLAALGPMN
jgi:Flp pilus assembly CpaE family ATPase